MSRKCAVVFHPAPSSSEVMEVGFDFRREEASVLEEHCTPLEEMQVKDMRAEAEAIVKDVLFAVSRMFVSHQLSSSTDVAYINLETREGQLYCLELSEGGLRVVGHTFDVVDESYSAPYHESVYSLLDGLSPAYRQAFGNALLTRLERLTNQTQQEDDH